MYRKKLTLIGPLPKETATGVTMGFQSLLQGCQERGVSFQYVDLQMAGEPTSHGLFSFRRLWQLLGPILLAIYRIPWGRTTYLTIACSKAGFAKDFVIIWWSWLWCQRIVLHLKSGGYGDFYQALPVWQQHCVRVTLNRADRIIALGQSIRHQFDFVHDPESKVVVVPNGPPPELAVSGRPPKTLSPKQPIRILYLSNLIPSKGFMDVLQACRILQETRGNRYQFDFCGAFPLTHESMATGLPQNADEFITELQSLPFPDRARYHGTVRGSDKQRWFEESHVFVLPTQYPTEGQPISIIEAMANGLPVVTTAWRGIVDQVVEGKTGTFVEFGNPDSLAEGILRVTEDPDQYEDLSRQSIQRYSDQFTREVHLDRMLAILIDQRDPA